MLISNFLLKAPDVYFKYKEVMFLFLFILNNCTLQKNQLSIIQKYGQLLIKLKF